MKKCEVLNKAILTIEKGSVVIVDERQYEIARKILKPIEADKPLLVEKKKKKK